MAVSVTTGKSATFTYKTNDGSAQVTEYSISQTASAETIETLAATAVLSSSKERSVDCSFLFDGGTANGFYAALQAAFDDGQAGTLRLEIDGWVREADAVVTDLSTAVPADSQVTCDASFQLATWTVPSTMTIP